VKIHCEHNPAFSRMMYLPFLEVGTETEIYMCECGALIDFRAEKNSNRRDGLLEMSPEDVRSLILALTSPLFSILEITKSYSSSVRSLSQEIDYD